MAERPAIYRLRHAVYARELKQHPPNTEELLRDDLDTFNEFIVLRRGRSLIGCISLTPPGHGRFSADKYVDRELWPFKEDMGLYEVRLLTVPVSSRQGGATALLLYAAYRLLEARKAHRVIGMGRAELMPFYRKLGFTALSKALPSGDQHFHFMTVTMETLHQTVERYQSLIQRLVKRVNWQLPVPALSVASCFHGGAFFEAIGEEFDNLDRRRSVINADVLDAWFSPAPEVTKVVAAHLPWVFRTSPPTQAEGLCRVIADARKVRPENLVVGAGSSALIFLAFQQWLSSQSRVLLPEITYGEYGHVLERVIGCTVDRFPIQRTGAYDLDALKTALNKPYDLVVLVNPNNPTGHHTPRSVLEPLLRGAPLRTKIWIDEAYSEYAGTGESLEYLAAEQPNIVVCKSMSKVYALSGLRVAYLCLSPTLAEGLRRFTPPWAVSLPAQIAAVAALRSPDYYAACYAETHRLRQKLAEEIGAFGIDIIPGRINSLLCQLPDKKITPRDIVYRCRQQGLYLRDFSSMRSEMASRWLRIAVKDSETNRQIVQILGGVLRDTECAGTR